MINNTICVEVRDWAVGGGEHLNGELIYHDSDGETIWEKLTYKLTETQAVKLNKADGKSWNRHQVDEESRRFFSYLHLHEVALKRAKEINTNLIFLFESTGYPSKVLWAKNKAIKEQLNEIYSRYNKIAHLRGRTNTDKTDLLIDEWEDVFDAYDYTTKGDE